MIFLDNSSSSFYKPPCVISAVTSTIKHLPFNASRAGHNGALKAGRLIYATRKRMGGFLGCSEERIIFTGGCTEALNLAIFGSAKKGGHVITTPFEHNSVLRPLFHLSKSGVIRLSVVTSASAAASAIKPETCLVAVNHVSNVTGRIMPPEGFAELCQKRRIPLLVDGAQSVGHIKIDMKAQGISMLALSPHKGLHAIQGAGVLAVLDDVVLAPYKFGGTGTASSSPRQPADFPEGFESGTLPLPAIAGINAGLVWTDAHFDANNTRLLELSAYLIEKLSAVRGLVIYSIPNVCGIVAFNIKGTPSSAVGDILCERYDIAVRCGMHCAPLLHEFYGTKDGMIRASIGCTNTYGDIDALVAAVREIARR